MLSLIIGQNHSVTWDATYYSSGIYFVKMVSNDYINSQKIMLVK